MSTPEIHAKIDQIFAEVDQRLELIISQHRSLLMGVDISDPLYEGLFAFCDELEALRKKINNKNASLSDRVEYIGNVSQYIMDFIQDIADFKRQAEAKNFSNETLSILTSIESNLHFIKTDSSEIEDEILQHDESENVHYFTLQQSELKKIMNAHPDLL